jgi:type VI secretion system protein ImpG
MFNRYYQQELNNLRELGSEFSKAHPAIAPMLSGSAADPDVERLLEGVAFLTGLLRQKLDDEFPEVIHDLMQLIWPHYLRPVPSTTMMAFSPKPTLRESMIIPAGVQIASIPVEGTTCYFRTASDVEIHPLRLSDVRFSEPAGCPPVITLAMELDGLQVADWKPQSLRFFLSGNYTSATDTYFLLRHHLKRIVIKPGGGGTPYVLSGDFLKPAGFLDSEALIPYPSHAFPGYRILQEYFVAPQKFLFLDLFGWEQWNDRGDGSRFEINFELDDLPFPPSLSKDSFLLFVTPAINIFANDSDPIMIDHKQSEYLVRPSGSKPDHYQIYSVDKVVGFVHGTAEERAYENFNVFTPEPRAAPIYHLTFRGSPVRPGFDVYLSVAYPPESGVPVSETLSTYLLCTNGILPDRLQVGDISQSTSSSPAFAEFKNITPPTQGLLPPIGTNLHWRLLSHLSLNYLSLARTENLRALLELYIFPETRDQAATLANKKRINGIEDIEAMSSDRLVSGIMMRGQDIRIKMRQDHFASQGDLYLFGCVLDHFFGNYASLNTYTRLIIRETTKGNIYQWPARLGNHPLI